MKTRHALLAGSLVLTLMLALSIHAGCDQGTVDDNSYGGDGGPPPPPCKGTDADGDGYGTGCDKGNDCNDNDPLVNPGAKETCNGKDDNCNGVKDEGVKNACGTCSQGCGSVGKGVPFPVDPKKDPNVKEANGVKLDKNGDLVLGKSMVKFNYLWIANTYDYAGSATYGQKATSNYRCRGTISKVDTKKLKEVARYFTVTCNSIPGSSGCLDVNGKAIQKNHNHTPSRTAVDYNFDVWVANRSVHGGQPSATKIAADPIDCIDRNKNGKIDTSADKNGDGKITIDCNNDNVADKLGTKCSGSLAGKGPEFLGDDDECVLFTTNYGEKNDVGRSLCLSSGKAMIGASTAWAGTFYREENGRGNNRFYKLNGNTGKIETSVKIAAKHHSYGCMADAHNIIWSTDIYGSLTYFQSVSPYSAGPKLVAPWVPKKGKKYHHYGIAIDGQSRVWLGGYNSSWVLRYHGNRANFASLAKGIWTRIDVKDGYVTRGIAVDNRGFVWVAIQNGGYILRLAQNLANGVHNRTATKNIWKTTADTVIGVGVDFDGHIWAVGHKNNIASRLDVDAKGNVISPPTSQSKNVTIGRNPYTYSDFTGYGLMNFVRPSGRYVYQMNPCPKGVKAQWKQIHWKATTPPSTSVALRVRTGNSATTFGSWSSPHVTSPVNIDKGSANAVTPNPAYYIQVEFTLTNKDKQTTPILHDFGVAYTCVNVPG